MVCIPILFAPRMSASSESPIMTLWVGKELALFSAVKNTFGFGFFKPTSSEVVTVEK